VQGYRGIYQSGFTTAVAELLDGMPPSEALRQFDMKYGQFAGPEQYPLGQVVLTYQDWLHAHHWPHTADRFRAWTREGYQPGASLTPATDRDDAVARTGREASVTR
jgi:hypothetical protein